MEDRWVELERRIAVAEARAERAERWVRMMGRTAIAAVLGLSGSSALGSSYAKPPAPAPSTPLKVSKMTAPFEVVDPSGRVLMIVENASPGPRLQLYGSTGKPVVTLGSSTKGGGALTVTDRMGKPAFAKP